MSGDVSPNPELILELLNNSGNAHFVSASLYINGGSSDAKKHQKLMSQLLKFAFTIASGEKIYDISGNYKLYRKLILLNLKLSCKNFEIIQELVLKPKFCGRFLYFD
jgi:dolichol-phosphate mannosyltransferase